MKTTRLWILALAAMLLIGCAQKAPASLSPTGVLAWQANQAVLTLDSIQDHAIGLNKIQKCDTATPTACSPLLSDQNTRLVIDAVGAGVRSIEQLPSGWRAVTSQTLAEIRKSLDATGKQTLAAWLTVGDVFLKEVQ